MIRIGSLCSGYGGLEMGVQAVLGGDVAWHSEYEPPTEKHPNPSQAAARVLAHRWPGVPNIGDMTAARWATLAPVDVLCGGTPCQDVSHAGARAGMRAGTRSGLWSAMADAIDVLRPRLVVWENVRGVLSAEADSGMESCPLCVGDGTGPVLRALGRVLGDLAELGYDTRWCGLRASDIGAPHDRFRVFVAAYPRSVRRDERWPAGPGEAPGRWPFGQLAGRGERATADPENDGRTLELAGRHEPQFARAEGDRPAVTDPSSERGTTRRGEPHGDDGSTRRGRESDAERADRVALWGEYWPAIERWERVLGRPAPAPTIRGSRGNEQLNPQLSEWMMGVPAGWVTEVPGVSIPDQRKVLGNGVVPQQAAAALRHMFEAA